MTQILNSVIPFMSFTKLWLSAAPFVPKPLVQNRGTLRFPKLFGALRGGIGSVRLQEDRGDCGYFLSVGVPVLSASDMAWLACVQIEIRKSTRATRVIDELARNMRRSHGHMY